MITDQIPSHPANNPHLEEGTYKAIVKQVSTGTYGLVAAITSVEDYKYEARDVKIDVFGEVAVMTFFPHRSRRENGEMIRYSARQTLVFLKTAEGWKIVHEHQSQVKFSD